MDSAKIAKQMIDFQKTTFDNMYNSMVMLQDHTEKLANTLFEQATWIPEESSRIVNQCLQLHGGYGYLKDNPIERILRDLRVHQILEGTNEIMRVIIAKDVLK